MKINVIGGGPAGLYFAASMKQQDPSHSITVFERDSQGLIEGFGYTIQDPIKTQLHTIDRTAIQRFDNLLVSQWLGQELEAKDHVIRSNSDPMYGIRRNSLLRYLGSLAQDLGVEIKYDSSISIDDVDHYKNDADILVGADGIHSIVRERYKDEFGSSYVNGTNSYIWLLNNSPEKSLRIVFQGYKNSAFIGSSYPHGTESSSMIIECTEEGLKESGLDGKVHQDGTISKSGLELLTEIFRDRFHNIALESQHSRWTQPQLITSNKIFTENVTLIGDSVFSPYYELGVGLWLAFESATELAFSLRSSKNLLHSLVFYNCSDIGFLVAQLRSDSLSSIRWKEDIDRHYKTLEGKELIDSFLTSK